MSSRGNKVSHCSCAPNRSAEHSGNMPAERSFPIITTDDWRLSVEWTCHKQQICRYGGKKHAYCKEKGNRIRTGRLIAPHRVGYERIETAHQKTSYKAENDAARGGGFGRLLAFAVSRCIDNDGDRDKSHSAEEEKGIGGGAHQVT